MNLQDNIATMQKKMLPSIPEETLKVMMSVTKKLIDSGIADKAMKSGDKAPTFSLVNTKGERIDSQKLLQKGPLVINFYRGAWCPYCDLELKALNETYEQITKLGANLIAISPNTRGKSEEFLATNPFKFDLLSDEGNKVAKQFRLVFELAEELRPIYNQFGINIPEHDGNNSYEIPIPATYIVGTNGIIVCDFVDADYTKRMEPDKILDKLKTISS